MWFAREKQITVRLVGGLGNQMFQYTAARAVAIRTHGRLFLDLSWFGCVSGRSFKLGEFEIVAEAANDEKTLGQVLSFARISRIWKFLRRRIGLEKEPRCLTEKTFCYDPAIRTLLPPIYLDGYWQSERYFDDCMEAIRREFRFRVGPSPIAAELIKEINSCTSVCLHVRRGDYVTDQAANRVHGVLSIDYYQRAAMLIRRQFPYAIFYVFSNDPGWVTLHLSPLFELRQIRLEGPDADLSEFRLMRSCSHFIIANSSFSWWAAWLGENPEKQVIAPTPWFKDASKDTRDLIPANWIKLEAHLD